MSHLCSFTYAAFALAFVYFVLFILVLRYLLNLMRSNSTKKRAQKIFLAILIAQTLLRVLYFLLFPFSSTACSPSMKGNDRPDEGTRSPEWWIHLLGNLPAMLFLSAFSVLVYTFARIYHRVLLAGIWFHERRFKVLTAFLVLLNLVSLIAIFGDWSYATTRSDRHLAPFVTMLLSCITGVSIILAILFLGYGSLLFFQVQSIIRASAESVTGTSDSSGAAYATKDYSRLDGQGARDIGRHGGPGHSFSTRGGGGAERPSSILLPATSMAGSLAAPLMPALTFANDAGTGFTPTHAHRVGAAPRRSPTSGSGAEGEGEGERADRDPNLATEGGNGGDEEGSYEPGPMYLPPAVGGGAGLNSSPTKAGSAGFAPAGTSAPVTAGAASAHYSLSGFLSPNLPIRNNNVSAGGGEVIAAHSYRSSVSASYTPMGSAAANMAAASGAAATSGSNNSNSTESGGVLGLPQIPSGYASSVSPEYSKLPNSSKNAANAHRALLISPNGTTVLSATANTTTAAGTASSGTPITPTDALVGSVPYAHAAAASASQQHAYATPRRGTSSLARQSPAPGAAGGAGHVSASAQRQNGAYQPQHDAEGEDDGDDSVEEAPGAAHGRVVAKNGLTNAHYYHSGSDENGVTSVYPSVSRHGSTRGLGSSQQLRPADDYARHDEGRLPSTMDTTARAALLAPAVAPPPNPMRKIAVIAAICVACLIARAGLIVGMSASGHDFSAVTTVIYFVLSEVAPLFGMLKVFNTPTPLVHVLGNGGGGPGGF